jgi:UDP-N-acetylmuramate: L-alanyl-gamma-D-glutamyl-meso-diaminopimelate ligase
MDRIPETERLDSQRLVGDIRKQHKEVYLFEKTRDLLAFLLKSCAAGDLVLCMSNGSFDGLPQRLLSTLKATGNGDLQASDNP